MQAMAALNWEHLHYPANRRLGGPQRWFGWFEMRENLLLLTGSNPAPFSPYLNSVPNYYSTKLFI